MTPGVGWGGGGGAEKTSREKTFSRDSRDAGVSLPGSLAASFAFGSARSGIWHVSPIRVQYDFVGMRDTKTSDKKKR